MGYVEWLRVRGCLKVTAFALGCLFLLAVVARLALMGHHDYVDWAYGLKSDPASQVTQTTLADGTQRTTIDNSAKQLHVVIDDRGSRGKHIEIDDYSAQGSSDLSGGSLMLHNGNKNESKLPGNRGTRIVIDSDSDVTNFVSYVIVGLIVAFIVATVLGVPFARENDGHLEVALTKPASRERFSAAVLGIDIGGIAVVFVAGIVFAIAAQSLFELPRVSFAARDAMASIGGIFAPVAWYSMLAAATASIRRGYGAVLGFAWPVAAIVLGLSLVTPGNNAVLNVVHSIAWSLSFINPLTYTTVNGSVIVDDSAGHTIVGFADGGHVVALALLSAFYCALAILQWRRVEA